MSFKTMASSSISSALPASGSRSRRFVAVICEAFLITVETGFRDRVVTNQRTKKNRREAACRDESVVAEVPAHGRLVRPEGDGGLDHEHGGLAAGHRQFEALAPEQDSLASR